MIMRSNKRITTLAQTWPVVCVLTAGIDEGARIRTDFAGRQRALGLPFGDLHSPQNGVIEQD